MLDLFVQTITNILTSMAKSYPVALAVITLFMILLLGRVRIGLLSMVPNLVPILLVVGLMGWLEIPLDFSTMLIGSIALGLVVDDTIHFLHTFAREQEAGGGVSAAVNETLLTTGRAIFVTSLTLGAGFYTYMAATLSNVFHFGLLTGTVVLLAMLADFLLVPALMAVVFRKR
jgi:predicted RND superfamily exporter protein